MKYPTLDHDYFLATDAAHEDYSPVEIAFMPADVPMIQRKQSESVIGERLIIWWL